MIDLIRQSDGSYTGAHNGRSFVVAKEPDRRGRLRWFGKLGLVVTLACKSRQDAVSAVMRMIDAAAIRG